MLFEYANSRELFISKVTFFLHFIWQNMGIMCRRRTTLADEGPGIGLASDSHQLRSELKVKDHGSLYATFLPTPRSFAKMNPIAIEQMELSADLARIHLQPFSPSYCEPNRESRSQVVLSGHSFAYLKE